MSLVKSELTLNSKARQLLEAAGYTDVALIAAADATLLREKLMEVNQQAKIYIKLPAISSITQWIEDARQLTSPDNSDSEEHPSISDKDGTSELVNFELDPDVVEMIAMAPLALPIPGKSLAEKQVPVSEIPEGILLTAARGDVSIRVGTKSPEKTQPSQVVKTPVNHGSYVNTISFGLKKEEVDRSRIRSIQEFIDPDKQPNIEEQRARAEQRIRVMRAALPETNEGVDPSSRRYIRGVLHSNPQQVWWGAVFTLASQILIPLGIFAAFALLLKDNGSSLFRWVPSWFLAFPLGVFVAGILYLLISYNSSCRICGQKCFVPRNCLKNRKAHHIPVLGYVFAVAVHIVLFRWFRCTYCGTPVRLKE
jgi:hypothetical protein